MKTNIETYTDSGICGRFYGTACENNDLNIDAGTFPETEYRSFYGYITKR